MGKKLKVCLAMGGGVSLGSFSGSALTEALKLLVLYGKDSDGEQYDEIVIDGMSGASAGAIALTIMLRCLIDYESMLPLVGANTTESDLIKSLAKDYFNNDTSKVLTHKNHKSLIALQLAQEIQYKIWVEEVDSVKLYGGKIKDKYKADPNKSFSLLDRSHLESLAKKYLIEPDNINIENRQLLDCKRVIFACSLTNLLPIQVINSSKKSNTLEKNIIKSTSSDNHSELRVIDFVFDDSRATKSDDRWLRFCNKPNFKDPTNFNIKSKEAWSTISASALACGAFPVAFEPVLLRRYQKEFGGYSRGTTWPKSFIEIQQEIESFKRSNPGVELKENSFSGEKNGNKLDYKSFNFPYVDGGTFNNEPISEAFKIGTFQDFGRDLENEERLVLFVDPIVRKEHYRSFKVSSFSPVKDINNRTHFKTEVDKLTGNISNLLGVLMDQGRVKEEHKISDTRENFKLRKTIFDYINSNQNMNKNLNVEFINTAFNKVTLNLTNNVLSVGTRDPIIYLIEEIRKSCLELEHSSSFCVDIDRDRLYDLKVKIDADKINSITQVYECLGLKTHEDQNAFAQAVFKVLTDISLNTEGKSEKSYRAAILPVNANLQTVELPGSEIEAFGGFASLKSRQYSFEFAKLSALLCLKETVGFRMMKSNKGKFQGKPFIVDNHLNNIKKTFISKIDQINFFDNNEAYSKDLSNNLFAPSILRFKSLLISNKFLSFMLLKVPFAATALFGVVAMPVISVVSIWKSVFKKVPWRGKSIIDNLIEKGSDQVKYVALEPVTLSILCDNKLNRNFFVNCLGEDKARKLKIIEHVFKATCGKKRYQYFFKVYLAEYVNNNDISPDNVSSKLDALKTDSEFIEKMCLTLSNKVKVPTHIDGNLYPKEKRLAVQQNYDRIIEGLTIHNYKLPSIEKAINDPFSLLHYSFKNINFHVNPIVEIDIQKLDSGWYFREQTESLDKQMLN